MTRTHSRRRRLQLRGRAALASGPRRAREGGHARRARTCGADGRIEGEEVRRDARAEHAVEQLQRLRGRPQRLCAARVCSQTSATEPSAAPGACSTTRSAHAAGARIRISASGPSQAHSAGTPAQHPPAWCTFTQGMLGSGACPRSCAARRPDARCDLLLWQKRRGKRDAQRRRPARGRQKQGAQVRTRAASLAAPRREKADMSAT